MTPFKAIQRASIVLACAIVFALPVHANELATSTPERVGLNPNRLALIKPHFDDLVAREVRSGFVIAIAREGKVAYEMATGLRDREKNLPMTMDTKFRMASMTKPITSVAAMILVEEGKLSLNDPVSKYLPEFANMQVVDSPMKNEAGEIPAHTAKSPITVFNLLNHTAGLGYLFDGQSDLGKSLLDGNLMFGPSDIRDFTRQLAAYPLYFEPGARWQYSFSVDVLAAVVEVASGIPFEDFVQARIFDPLDMKDSRFILDEGFCSYREARQAIIYRYDENGDMQPTDAETCGLSSGNDQQNYPAGGAGMISTARDYMRFLQMMANEGALDGMRILSPNTVHRMTSNSLKPSTIAATPGMADSGGGFGLGFAVTLDEGLNPIATSHGEFNWGGYFGTTFWVAPNEGNLIAIMLSQRVPGPNDPVGYSEIRNQFRELVYGALKE